MPLPLLAIMLRPWAWLIVATKILLQNLCKYQISKGLGRVTVAGCLLPRVSAAGCFDQLVKAAARGWRLSGAAAGAVWRHQASGRRIWVRHNTLELQTNLREIFTITEKARDLKVLIFPQH